MNTIQGKMDNLKKKLNKTYVVAEIGINHNGNLELAKAMIDIAKQIGCSAVKFQKRTVEKVYTKEQLDQPRLSYYGKTNGDLKRGLEFGVEEYRELIAYCKEKSIDFFASPWDTDSVDILNDLGVAIFKVASACIASNHILYRIKETGKGAIISTGMSNLEEIRNAVEVIGEEKSIILSCTSIYPTQDYEINLNKIDTLKREFPNAIIGYSGHEVDILPSLLAVAKGCKIIERHVTISRYLWGSDQKVSLEPYELKKLVDSIRRVEKMLGNGKIEVMENEIPMLKKLKIVD